jgi:multiple antibiotic resistance protein
MAPSGSANHSLQYVLGLSTDALVVTGGVALIFLAGRVSQRISRNTTLLLVRIAGILLTAIAVTLLVGGGTRMVRAVLNTQG